MGKVRIIVIAGAAALLLAGCYRESALYEINHDGTVDAVITINMQESFTSASEPYRGIAAVQKVLDHFVTDSISNNDYGTWLGYTITLDNEPMASFAAPATESWDLQILGDDSDWVVYGMEYDASQDGMRSYILDNDGYLTLAITFPGDLVEEDGAAFTMVPAPGVAQWNMGTVVVQPYARGRMPFVGPPEPPEPDPVVTVVITPHPDPVVTPGVTPSASPSASAAPAAAPTEGGDDIPVWVWGVGAGLLAAIVGLGTYALASRPKAAATEPDDDEPEDEDEEEDDEEPEDDKDEEEDEPEDDED